MSTETELNTGMIPEENADPTKGEPLIEESEGTETKEETGGVPETASEKTFSQKDVGKLLSAERRKNHNEIARLSNLERELAELKSRQSQAGYGKASAGQEGNFFDEVTGEYYTPESAGYMIALYNHKAREKQGQRLKNQYEQTKSNRLQEAYVEGETRYDNFAQMWQELSEHCSLGMVEGISAATDIPALVNHLYTNRGDLERLKGYTNNPAKQVLEMGKMEERFTKRIPNQISKSPSLSDFATHKSTGTITQSNGASAGKSLVQLYRERAIEKYSTRR